MTMFQKLKSYIGLGPKEPTRKSSKPAATIVPAVAPSKSRPGENRAVFVAVTSRMIITPLLFMPVLATLAKYDLFRAAEDPVFIVSHPSSSTYYMIADSSTARSNLDRLLASGPNSRSNHPSSIRRRIRASDQQNDQLVLCCAYAAVDVALYLYRAVVWAAVGDVRMWTRVWKLYQ